MLWWSPFGLISTAALQHSLLEQLSLVVPLASFASRLMGASNIQRSLSPVVTSFPSAGLVASFSASILPMPFLGLLISLFW